MKISLQWLGEWVEKVRSEEPSWLPVARLVDGELLWLVDGYVPAQAFPLATRIEWKGRPSAGLRAALLATVSAQTGAASAICCSSGRGRRTSGCPSSPAGRPWTNGDTGNSVSVIPWSSACSQRII